MADTDKMSSPQKSPGTDIGTREDSFGSAVDSDISYGDDDSRISPEAFSIMNESEVFAERGRTVSAYRRLSKRESQEKRQELARLKRLVLKEILSRQTIVNDSELTPSRFRGQALVVLACGKLKNAPKRRSRRRRRHRRRSRTLSECQKKYEKSNEKAVSKE